VQYELYYAQTYRNTTNVRRVLTLADSPTKLNHIIMQQLNI